jgi:hypothetical protein
MTIGWFEGVRAIRVLTFLPVLIAGYYAAYIWLGARLPVGDGLGWDGQLYAVYARDFFGQLSRFGVNSYHTNRLLPSFLVWCATKLAGVDLSGPASVVTAFHIYNGILLAGTGLVWSRIAAAARLPLGVGIVGFASLFVNWAVLQYYGFYAVLTDVTAYFLGTLVALTVIERRWLLLSATTLIASFAWNTVFPLCFLFVLFPYPTRAELERQWAPTAATVVAAVVALICVLFGVEPLRGFTISIVFLPFSLVALAGYVWWVVKSFPTLPLLWSLRIGSPVALATFGTAWLVSAVGLAVFDHWYGVAGPSLGLKAYLLDSVATAVAKPGVFLLAHTVFFGPAMLMILISLPAVLRAAVSHSTGAALFLLTTLAMMLDAESRWLTFAFPTLVTFLCMAYREQPSRRAMVTDYLVCCLLLSKVYLPLGLIFRHMTPSENPMEFPLQWMFMNIGPYMGWGGYAFNLVLVLAAYRMLLRYRATLKANPTSLAGN